MRSVKTFMALAGGLVLLLSGCGGGTAPAAAPAPVNAATSAAMPGMVPSPDPSTGAAAPVAANTVLIKNFAFSPAALTVRVGTTVTWTNQDADAHTVTSRTGPLNSPTLDTGKSYRYTFTKPGTYQYLCTIHPFMTATVTVTG